MTRLNNLSISCLLYLFFICIIVSFLLVRPQMATAQEEEYYQELQENNEIPEYEDSPDYAEEPYYDDQNPDPEFMDENEPGEYDQSDDVMDTGEVYN